MQRYLSVPPLYSTCDVVSCTITLTSRRETCVKLSSRYCCSNGHMR